jgi:hypothetical protein
MKEIQPLFKTIFLRINLNEIIMMTQIPLQSKLLDYNINLSVIKIIQMTKIIFVTILLS